MKKTLTRIVLLLTMVLTLCALLSACTVPEMEDAGGNPTWAGLVIQMGMELVTYFVITLVGIVAAWLMAKIGNNKDLQNVKLAIGILQNLAQETAGELKQKVVDDLKAAQGGKLTDEQKKRLPDELLELVLQKVDDNTINILEAAGADINAIILGAAEDWIGIMHRAEDSDEEEAEIPPLEDWPLEMLRDFCRINGIPAAGCQSESEYIAAIMGGAKEEKPPSQEVET